MSQSNSSGAALSLWLNSLDLPTFGPTQNKRTLSHLSEIQDGEILWQVLATLDASFFRAPRPSSMSGTMSEAWVLRFTSFKKMYKLISRYFEEELRKKPKHNLPSPNLHKIAKDGDLDESVSLCMLILTLATLVQPDLHVPKLQALPTWAQTALMVGIQTISDALLSLDPDPGLSGQDEDEGQELDPLGSHTRDEEYERYATVLMEKKSLQKSHNQLLEEYKLLKQAKDETSRRLYLAEQDLKTVQEDAQEAIEAASSAKHSKSGRDNSSSGSEEEEEEEIRSSRSRSSSRPDYLLRSERDQLKAELANIGAKLDESEAVHERQSRQLEEQRRRLDELADVEEQNRGLRDQLDEVRHEMERARKLENVIEKYKKKLDESADLRRQMKTLEEQNTDLLERNASLEDEYRKVAAFKPLMEQYKTQIATLESSLSAQKRDTDRLQYELETTTARLQQAEEERNREAEELALFEERVKELEDEQPIRQRRRRPSAPTQPDDSMAIDDSFDVRAAEEETGIIAGIGGELNDAMEGRTMTSLKLELRKLKRELKALQSAQDDGEGEKKSRYLVLENLLEDANRMKRKYEDDYLNEFREKLMIANQLEEIRSGKSASGDGPEATIALRQRLNETVTELEKLKAEYAELTVSQEQLSNELTTAKSDLHLVGKDQLEILDSLRESVSTEKIGLMNEVDRLKTEQSSLRDQIHMKTDQIQSLLLEKISLQSDSIGQREQMLKREREMSSQGKTLNHGGEMSENDRIQLGVMERLCKEREDEIKIVKSKLEKARMFIVDQHKMIQQQASGNGGAPLNVSSLAHSYEDLEETTGAEIERLKEEIARLKTVYVEMDGRYQHELRLMTSAWHNMSQQKLRETIALNRNDSSRNAPGKGGGGGLGSNSNGFGGTLRPHSWVKQQRDRLISRDGLR